MLIDTYKRAETALRDLAAKVADSAGSSDEMRLVLNGSKALAALVCTVQAKAASNIAATEGHGDNGVQLLADAAGITRRDARSQANTDRMLDAMPAARAAVDAGEVSLSNARALANIIQRVGLGEVAADATLLDKAATERPEQFNRTLRRWAVDREGDDGAAEHARQRNNRDLRIFTGDDNMTHIHARLDPVTGKRIENHLQREAKRRWADAKKNPRSDCKTFRHALADAFAALITSPASEPGSTAGFADIAITATVSDNGERLIGELAGGDRLPPGVLEELMCDARIAGVLFNRAGTAIWQGKSSRVATEAQKRQLIRTYGGWSRVSDDRQGLPPLRCDHLDTWSPARSNGTR